ncbi:MAG: endo-1,4-beta-xylanase [Chitinophagaceae bacterium]
MKKELGYILLCSALILGACRSTHKFSDKKLPSLAAKYKNDFLIGTALDLPQINGADPATMEISKTQFDATTPENIMKCEEIHPAWNKYLWNHADLYVSEGQKNKQFIVGHTLIWHSQLSPFVRQIQSKDSLLLFMQNHIATVAGRYTGKIGSWDVVNEALNEDGSFRKSVFYNLLGADYIPTAFQLAAKADPHAQLYYNDYNIEQPEKRAGAIALIKLVKANGGRIDGIGIQGHWHVNDIPFKAIEESIKEFSALGVKVAFTELDLSVLPNPKKLVGADVNQHFEGSNEMNPYTQGLPDSVGKMLADQYAQLFKLFLKYKKDISRVTFWGTNDKQSWLNDFPVKGRTNYPLLFDRNNQPKKAFYSLINLKN